MSTTTSSRLINHPVHRFQNGFLGDDLASTFGVGALRRFFEGDWDFAVFATLADNDLLSPLPLTLTTGAFPAGLPPDFLAGFRVFFVGLAKSVSGMQFGAPPHSYALSMEQRVDASSRERHLQFGK